MNEKECQCRGLDLTRDLIDVFTLWANEALPDRKLPLKLSESIVSHLEAAKDIVGTTEQGDELIEKLRTKNRLARFGDEHLYMDALDMVRDTIHQNDELKRLLVCNTPSKDVVKTILTIMGDADITDAVEPLERHYQEVTCTTQGG